MNSGVADAVSAAGAIHTAINTDNAAITQQASLTFAEERQRAAHYNRDAAGGALQHLQGRSIGKRIKRFVAASLASTWPDPPP